MFSFLWLFIDIIVLFRLLGVILLGEIILYFKGVVWFLLIFILIWLRVCKMVLEVFVKDIKWELCLFNKDLWFILIV